jgi:hypothetical protein
MNIFCPGAIDDVLLIVTEVSAYATAASDTTRSKTTATYNRHRVDGFEVDVSGASLLLSFSNLFTSLPPLCNG